MADHGATEAGSENPLIPNAKLRQMYSGMARLRTLSEDVGRSNRKAAPYLRHWEAPLVSTSVDLGPNDVVSDATPSSDGQSSVLSFLRGDPAEAVLEPKSPGRALRRKTLAGCGAAGRLPAGLGVQERMWAAVGAAGAAKARAGAVKTGGNDPQQAGVAIVYARAGEMAPRIWRKVLTYASIEALPILFVVLPTENSRPDSRTGTMSAIALQHGIPGMPVDCEDAVAIYRVAQEAIGRARDDGGPALIECVHFALQDRRPARKGPDALATLGEYLQSRRVANQAWMDRETNAFRRRIGLQDLHPRK